MRSLMRLLVVNAVIALVLMVAVTAYSPKLGLQQMVLPFVVSMTYSTAIGGLSWYVLPRLAPRFKRSQWERWTGLLALLTGISLAGGSVAWFLLVYQPLLPIRMDYQRSMMICWVMTMAIGSISYVVEEAKHKVQATTLQLRTRELEREKALKAASEAKLQSLESRIHPHFLFNTLNSISSLVRSNPEEAEALIERLAALLRFSLDRHGSLVRLEDEIQITRDYLEIEKARFGERLRFRFELDPELEGVKVPALSVQTLAENSVKYAVGALRGGAEIVIRARRNGAFVELEIADSGPGFSPESLPAGHGLDTLRQRLEALFGEQAKLWTRQLETGMEVSFRVPC